MKLGPRAIIVTPKEYFPLLFAYRSSHPEEGFKLLDKEALLDRASFRYRRNPIPALLRQNLDYVCAKKWMRIFRVADIEKSKRAKTLFDSISEDCVETDELGEFELTGSSLFLLEMQEDLEIHALLKRKGYPFQDISFFDLGIPKVEQQKRVLLFQNKYDQFAYLFSSLRERLLRGDLKPLQARIHVKDEGDAFYLNLLGPLYGIPVRIKTKIALFSHPEIASACQEIYAQKSFDLDGMDEKAIQTLQPILEQYGLKDLPFDLAYSSLYEILTSASEETMLGEEGIAAHDSFLFSPDKETYLTCMQYGSFHNVYADEDVLSDSELLQIGANPSYVKTQLEKRLKKNYLSYQRFALLSRVKEHLDEKIYPSQFEEEEGYVVEEGPRFDASSGVNTTSSSKLFHMRELDRNFYLAPMGEYRSYDSRFQGIPSYRLQKATWSVTNLESYWSCPYRYYLRTVLPRSDDDVRPRYLGVLVHKALEGVYNEDYDLEKALLLGEQAYLSEREKDQREEIPYDAVLIELTKSNLRRYIPLIRAQKDYAQIVQGYSEFPLRWSLSDEKGTYQFRGSIDALVLAKQEQRSYFALLDYKTGSEQFHAYEAPFGRSTQLPLYYMALKQNGFASAHQALFGGLGLKHVAFPSFKSAFGDSAHKSLSYAKGYGNLSAKGIYSSDLEFWECLDKTGLKADKKGQKADGKGIFFKAGKAFFDGQGAGTVSMLPRDEGVPYGLDELLQDASDATLRTIHLIEEGSFPIAPTSRDFRLAPKDDNVSCSYCPYKDICYHVLSRDKKDYSDAVRKYFKAKKEARHG